MKPMNLFSLVSFILIMNGCSNNAGIEKNETGYVDAGYNCEQLFISFQDVSGKDLVKGIGYSRDLGWGIFLEKGAESGGVLPDLYTLELVYPDPRMEPPKIFSDDGKILYYPTLGVQEIDGCSYLLFYYHTKKWADLDTQILLPPANWININLKCPYVFGDEAVHKIVSYWGVPFEDGYYMQKCKRIVLDGKEYIPSRKSTSSDGLYNASSVTVIVNK